MVEHLVLILFEIEFLFYCNLLLSFLMKLFLCRNSSLLSLYHFVLHYEQDGRHVNHEYKRLT